MKDEKAFQYVFRAIYDRKLEILKSFKTQGLIDAQNIHGATVLMFEAQEGPTNQLSCYTLQELT